MNDQELLSYVTDVWDRDIVPTLHDYIRIPNVSPVFEEDWESLGHMQLARRPRPLGTRGGGRPPVRQRRRR